MDSSDKTELSIFIPETKTSKPKAKNIDIAIIGANAYCTTCHLKEAQVFAISMKDISYQAEKEARAKTHLKSVIPQK